MRVCSQCDARYGDDAGFCPNDGTQLVAYSEPASALGRPLFAPPPSPTDDAAPSSAPSAAQPSFDPVAEPRVVYSAPASARDQASGVSIPSLLRPSSPEPESAKPTPPPGASEPVGAAQPAPGNHGQSRWLPADAEQPSAPERPAADGNRWAQLAIGESEEPLIGQILGDRYRVESRIGAGGMGVIYRASHVLIGRQVAIKVLRRRYAELEELAKRFAQEARLASNIQHPHVVDVIDFGTTPGGSPYCVMEFLAGHSLAQELRADGKVDPRRAVTIAIAVARGLSAVHQAGIIHRDLKPDNVFLVPPTAEAPAQIKILDFGIARDEARRTRLTAEGSVVGTPEYMSPEQARGEEVDARSDLYALGVLLYELISGRVPLSGDSSVGTLTKQVYEQPLPIREVEASMAACPGIEAVLDRLLAKDPGARPSTALEAAKALEDACKQDLDGAAPGWGAPPVELEARPRGRGRRSTAFIGSGSVTSAHEPVREKATGSFAAKSTEEASSSEPRLKRPSVIVPGATPNATRPARVLDPNVLKPTPPPQSFEPVGAPPGAALDVRPRRDGRYVPVVVLVVGAAIFAALATLGFMRWLQRRDARQDPHGMREAEPVGRSSQNCSVRTVGPPKT